MKLVDEEPCPCGSGKLYGECHKAMQRTTLTAADPSHISLNVIPEPAPNSRAVFKGTGTGTLYAYDPNGHYSLDCGACGAPLFVVSERQQISGIVLRCAACGEFNET